MTKLQSIMNLRKRTQSNMINKMETQQIQVPQPPVHAQPSTNDLSFEFLKKIDFALIGKILVIFAFSFAIFIFSMVMSEIADSRYRVYMNNYSSVGNLYGADVKQSAPSLNALEGKDTVGLRDSYLESGIPTSPVIDQLYKDYNNNQTDYLVKTKRYAENTYLVATTGNVTIDADFVKKGLSYQPTFKTTFKAVYVMRNSLDEASAVTFGFPFPWNTDGSEISNAVLKVGDKVIENAKSTVYVNGSYQSGLKWVGEIPANSDLNVEVSYNTVGLNMFMYEGFENKKGSQDFNFNVTINGTRNYNVASGLTVDQREFNSNSVKLIWDKKSLYTTPAVEVSIGDKLNPSAQVARVYQVMAPLYIIFMLVLFLLTQKFGKKFDFVDIVLTTVLFTIYFPLLHYLSSFTVDPTMEILSGFENVGYFSMPLYVAFAAAWVLVGSLVYYFSGKINGFGFASKYTLPLVVLFFGFFPLVVTIPEYAMLLVLIGAVAFIAVVVQVRINWSKA